jgi:hypothetical protein
LRLFEPRGKAFEDGAGGRDADAAGRDDDAHAAETVRAHLAAGVGRGNRQIGQLAFRVPDDVLQDREIGVTAVGAGGEVEIGMDAIGGVSAELPEREFLEARALRRGGKRLLEIASENLGTARIPRRRGMAA